MIDKGLNLMSVEEFGNDIVDYFIKYPTDILLDYLLKKRIITIKNYFIVNTNKAVKEIFYFEVYKEGTFSKGIAFEKDTRHIDLFNFLIDAKRYTLLT